MLRKFRVRGLLLPFAVLLFGGLAESGAQAAPPTLIASLARHFEPPFKSARLDWSRVHRDGDGFVEELGDGRRAELTIEAPLQARVEQTLRAHGTAYGAAVLLDVNDGRVIALAGHARKEDKSAAELALSPWAPAASVFKLVTATALVTHGVGPETRVCYHAGVHSVEPSNLRSNPRLDDNCNTLAYGIAKSQNAIIARLAHDHLDAVALARAAHALGFGARLPGALFAEPSAALVPEGGLAFARTAAGFWNTTLSPLHGAWLAATLARGGVTPPLRLIDRVVGASGVTRPEAAPVRRVVPETAARAVGRMMVGTTEFGTARLGFHDRRTHRALLPGIAVAGKTGTLDRKDPYLGYSWFVGFAPADHPRVAVAVLLGNSPATHVRAHQVAREVLSSYFDVDHPPRLAAR